MIKGEKTGALPPTPMADTGGRSILKDFQVWIISLLLNQFLVVCIQQFPVDEIVQCQVTQVKEIGPVILQ